MEADRIALDYARKAYNQMVSTTERNVSHQHAA